MSEKETKAKKGFVKWLLELLKIIFRPNPDPDPDPNPETDKYPDAINPKDITWLGPNISDWERKYTLKVSLSGDKIIYDQEGTANWPVNDVRSLVITRSEEVKDIPLMNIIKEDEDQAEARGDGATPRTELVGNPWIIAKLNGKWMGATHEWMRPGQKIKGKRSVHGDHIKRSEFGSDWTPTVGEEYGFVVSALARGGQSSVSERTQIVLFKWE